MTYIEFEVKGIGRFKTQESLTIEQDLRLESKVNDFLEGNLYEMETKAEVLTSSENEAQKKAGDNIRMQIDIVRIMFILEAVIVESPKEFSSIRAISGYDTLLNIWDAYSQKKRTLINDLGN
jgi:hypothetical protein